MLVLALRDPKLGLTCPFFLGVCPKSATLELIYKKKMFCEYIYFFYLRATTAEKHSYAFRLHQVLLEFFNAEGEGMTLEDLKGEDYKVSGPYFKPHQACPRRVGMCLSFLWCPSRP